MPNLLPLASRIRNLIVSLSLVALLYLIWHCHIHTVSHRLALLAMCCLPMMLPHWALSSQKVNR